MRFGGSAHLEETNLCLRIRGAGYKIVFDPKAELIHLKDTKGGCRAENNELISIFVTSVKTAKQTEDKKTS